LQLQKKTEAKDFVINSGTSSLLYLISSLNIDAKNLGMYGNISTGSSSTIYEN
jgi:hypothetical protein